MIFFCNYWYFENGGPYNPVDLQKKQECIRVGCVPSAAVVFSGGCLPGGGVSARGGGVAATHTHPVNRITDACENITLPQLRCGR